MKLQTAAIALLSLMAMPLARAEEATTMSGSKPMLTYEDVRKVAPALEAYTQNRLLGDVWKRPGLAPRDRSIVTLAALIARNQTMEMPFHFNLALDNGVKPREISEIITPSANSKALPLVVDCPITKYPFSYRLFTHYPGAERGG